MDVPQQWTSEDHKEQTQEDVDAIIRNMYEQYKDYVIPIADLWELLQKEMGDKTLTDEWRAMREGRQ